MADIPTHDGSDAPPERHSRRRVLKASAATIGALLPVRAAARELPSQNGVPGDAGLGVGTPQPAQTLRPEEYGGRVHQQRAGRAASAVHDSILSSPVLDAVFERQRTYLLPQAYPEGAPLHPSYPSGHATIAGACATVLKAFFHESFPIEEPVLAREDGLGLEPYTGPALTVGGELNKLASNVAFGRNAAGIHWRSDSVGGMRLGEAVALAFLAEMRTCLHEGFGGFSVTKFDGTTVTV